MKYAEKRPLKPTEDGEVYDPDSRLVAAVNVAVLLGKPLLVTGEPGTGKTTLAKSVAADLGYRLISYFAKSTSESQDLLYEYDAIGHFRKAQLKDGGNADPLPFVRVRALGEAILRASPPVQGSSMRGLVDDWDEFPIGAVVLIDEIDKAPRDFPNDLLLELDRFEFRIPELNDQATFGISETSPKPIVIVTSNSEKNLPDAFLRRCVYHDIQFPTGDAARERMLKIVQNRLRSVSTAAPWLSEAVDFFFFVRERYGNRLVKKPATVELIDLVSVIASEAPESSLKDEGGDFRFEDILGSVFKTSDDARLMEEVVEQWRTV